VCTNSKQDEHIFLITKIKTPEPHADVPLHNVSIIYHIHVAPWVVLRTKYLTKNTVTMEIDGFLYNKCRLRQSRGQTVTADVLISLKLKSPGHDRRHRKVRLSLV